MENSFRIDDRELFLILYICGKMIGGTYENI
jgi:hypothetical protein